MKLSRFIVLHQEEILVEWEAFASTMQRAAENMSPLLLRDYAKQILYTMAEDLEIPETAQQQYDKSKGLGLSDPKSAAALHGALRQIRGFSLSQLTAEFRALRATVLRLWLPSVGAVDDETVRDMVRFNETIDQAVAESAVTFTERAERARDTFLAMLGHDLRSPLATMSMAGVILTRPQLVLADAALVGARIKRSAVSMGIMINDMLQYARTQLGGEIPINREPADLWAICEAAREEAGAAHPECPFEITAEGELTGHFDAARLQQVFSNLLNNAAQYRSREHPVLIEVRGGADTVTVRICNRGPVIPPESLRAIFDPMVQLAVDETQTSRANTSMGLGLFIARQITDAHGGSIAAHSTESDGTVFTVSLPRN